MPHRTESPTLAALAGLWRRSLIVRADGSRDATSWVGWLQGRRRFVDLRQPADLPVVRAASLGQLTHVDCLKLAAQEGFAGELTVVADCFEWRREIDFQPRSEQPDAGHLNFEGEVLIELGRDVPYTEHWHREPGVCSPGFALALRSQAAERSRALLVRVGAWFMWARDRSHPLPAGHSLAALVGEASLEAARALIDCEISFGEVSGGYRIERSSQPWRVGDRLEPVIEARSVAVRERSAQGAPVLRHWTIEARED